MKRPDLLTLSDSAGWKLATAKQQLSKVVRLAQKEPQILSNRDEVVAAVISSEEFVRYYEWRQRHDKTLSEAFQELREMAEDESWELELPPRADRPNAFAETPPVEPKRAARKKAKKASK